MPHSVSSASNIDDAGQYPHREVCTGIGHPNHCIHIAVFSRPCSVHEMSSEDFPPSDAPSVMQSFASTSPSLALSSSLIEDVQSATSGVISATASLISATASAPLGLQHCSTPVTDDSIIDIEDPYQEPDMSNCTDCRIPAPTLPPDSTRDYQIYKIAVKAPPQERGPFYVLFVAHGGDIYGFAGTYFFVDGRLDHDNAYHEHLSNETPGSANHTSYEIIATIPAANMDRLKDLCRRVLPPRKQIHGGWEYCPWEPLYRSEDWVDDIITLGGRATILTPSSNYNMLERIPEEDELYHEPQIFPFTF